MSQSIVSVSNTSVSALSGGLADTGRTGEAGSSGSDGASSGDITKISATVATASTTGYQPNYATASDYDVLWTAADGQSGELDVEEGWSFTTDSQLVPLSPQLQASEGTPGVAADATGISVSGQDGESSASTTMASSLGSARASGDANAALSILEESSASSLRYGAFDKAAPRSSTTPSQQA